ncbi:unnamed protein product [Sympodiomycopsis kandeliae]
MTQPHEQDALFQKLLRQERVIQSAALQKKEMPSCLTLFDAITSCYAMVPQFRHIYRYGHANDCSDKVDDWKFCLSLKGRDKEQKYQAFIERKARAMARRRMPGGNTSEEVWTIRDDPIIQPQYVDTAFVPAEQSSQEDAT